MTDQMLVDTDVLVWHLRGYAEATRRLDHLPQLTLSAMSYLELLQGMRNKAELIAATALEHQLSLLTGNTKHFAPIAGLKMEKFAPTSA
jgi:predicted nucleic acid-binding protein